MNFKSTLQKQICQRIDKEIKRKGIKRKELAIALGVTTSLISRMFKCESSMSMAQLEKFVSYLNLDIDEIFVDHERPDIAPHVFDKTTADKWCRSTLHLNILCLLLRRNMTMEKLVGYFSRRKAAVRILVEQLLEEKIIMRRNDGILLINPHSSIRYNLSKAEKYHQCISDILVEQIQRMKGQDQQHKEHSFSKNHINWFTKAQLMYINEHLHGLQSAIDNFAAENSVRKYKGADIMNFISLHSLEVSFE